MSSSLVARVARYLASPERKADFFDAQEKGRQGAYGRLFDGVGLLSPNNAAVLADVYKDFLHSFKQVAQGDDGQQLISQMQVSAFFQGKLDAIADMLARQARKEIFDEHNNVRKDLLDALEFKESQRQDIRLLAPLESMMQAYCKGVHAEVIAGFPIPLDDKDVFIFNAFQEQLVEAIQLQCSIAAKAIKTVQLANEFAVQLNSLAKPFDTSAIKKLVQADFAVVDNNPFLVTRQEQGHNKDKLQESRLEFWINVLHASDLAIKNREAFDAVFQVVQAEINFNPGVQALLSSKANAALAAVMKEYGGNARVTDEKIPAQNPPIENAKAVGELQKYINARDAYVGVGLLQQAVRGKALRENEKEVMKELHKYVVSDEAYGARETIGAVVTNACARLGAERIGISLAPEGLLEKVLRILKQALMGHHENKAMMAKGGSTKIVAVGLKVDAKAIGSSVSASPPSPSSRLTTPSLGESLGLTPPASPKAKKEKAIEPSAGAGPTGEETTPSPRRP